MVNINQALEKVNSIDFSRQLFLLENRAGLSHDKACTCIEQYKKWLALACLHRGIVPNEEIDTAWHYHITDTKKYSQDCELLFGEYLHHYPAIDNRSENTEAVLITKDLWKKMYREEVLLENVFCAPKCNT